MIKLVIFAVLSNNFFINVPAMSPKAFPPIFQRVATSDDPFKQGYYLSKDRYLLLFVSKYEGFPNQEIVLLAKPGAREYQVIQYTSYTEFISKRNFSDQ